MNKYAEGDEYTFRTSNDWGTVTGVLLLMPNGKFLYRNIDLESGELEFAAEED